MNTQNEEKAHSQEKSYEPLTKGFQENVTNLVFSIILYQEEQGLFGKVAVSNTKARNTQNMAQVYL